MDMEKNTAELKDLSTASPRELADGIVEILDAKKAQEIKLLAVEEQTILADYFILCTGTSNTQVKALAGEVEFKLEQAGVHLRRMEGYQEGSWIVMDYSSVIRISSTGKRATFISLKSFGPMRKTWICRH